MPVPKTTNVVITGYSQARYRHRPVEVPTIVAAHHNAHPTCRLGIAAVSLTNLGGEPFCATVPKMWWTTSVSVMLGTTNLGGATG